MRPVSGRLIIMKRDISVRSIHVSVSYENLFVNLFLLKEILMARTAKSAHGIFF